jgi:AmmeMemoRadiSam system protein B
MSTREAYVAGRFYEGNRARLLSQLQDCIPPSKEKVKALGIVSPHAGYVYSGKVAGEVYAKIEIPGTAVVACPNHTGFPVDFSVWAKGEWRTPLGTSPIDEELASRILSCCKDAVDDEQAHLYEHSAEVQVPFLQHLKPDIRIVPIVVHSDDVGRLRAFGQGLAEAVKASGKDVLLVASTDMTHFESHESAKARDKLAIDAMLEMDEEKLWKTVRGRKITMCGVAPTVAVIRAVKDLGAKRAELVRYATSGEVFGDYDRVVGYAGLIFA